MSNEAVINIKDTGLGIAPKMLEDIFEMFGQIETSEEQARGGLGIGLSVVKKLVEMHGGSVAAASDGIGRGSEFTVRLPLAAEQSMTLPADPISEMDVLQTAQMEMPADCENTEFGLKQAQLRILIVDDNADATEMLKTLLSLQGHPIRTASDGKEAIEKAGEFEPEICLCDIGLPGMNGYELAVRLRGMFPKALLISISGWGQPEDRQKSRESGFNYHLIKLAQLNDLLKLIGSNSD